MATPPALDRLGHPNDGRGSPRSHLGSSASTAQRAKTATSDQRRKTVSRALFPSLAPSNRCSPLVLYFFCHALSKLVPRSDLGGCTTNPAPSVVPGIGYVTKKFPFRVAVG